LTFDQIFDPEAYNNTMAVHKAEIIFLF